MSGSDMRAPSRKPGLKPAARTQQLGNPARLLLYRDFRLGQFAQQSQSPLGLRMLLDILDIPLPRKGFPACPSFLEGEVFVSLTLH
jgi:hypothetical protein